MLELEELKSLKKYQYDEIIEKLQECLKYYQSYYARDNKYTLYLANGERINFEYNDGNIPHLLGVDITYLSSTVGIRGKNSYEVLKKFLDDSYSIYNKLKGDLSHVFSKYIDIKLGSFQDLIVPLSPGEIYFACKYDSSRKYQSDDEISYNADYYIARKTLDKSILLLGLVKKDNYYYPQSSRLISEDLINKELKVLLTNQVVTFVNNIRIENYQNGYNSELKNSLEMKKTHLLNLSGLCKNYDCDAVTVSEHLYAIRGLILKYGKATTEQEVLQELLQSIKCGQIYDLDTLDEEMKTSLSDEVLSIIYDCNNLIINGVKTDENQKLYSDIQRENVVLNQKLSSTSEQLELLKSENEKLREQLKQYELEKMGYDQFKTDIMAALERCNEKVNKKI